MKKIIIAFFILLLCGCQNSYTNMNYDSFYKKMGNHESYILLLCNNDCNKYKKELPNKKQIYYMDINKLNDKEKLVVESQVFDFESLSTPSIIIVENGSLKSKKIGDINNDSVVNFLKDNKVLEEKNG